MLAHLLFSLDFLTVSLYNVAILLMALKIGAVAQLGERLTGSQEVTGSNPVGSRKPLVGIWRNDEEIIED